MAVTEPLGLALWVWTGEVGRAGPPPEGGRQQMGKERESLPETETKGEPECLLPEAAFLSANLQLRFRSPYWFIHRDLFWYLP